MPTNERQVEPRGFFENPPDERLCTAVRGLGRAVRTIVFVPPHSEVINVSMKAMRLAEPLPQQPPIAEVQRTIYEDLSRHINANSRRPVSGSQLVRLSGVLIQFSDHVPQLTAATKTPYSHVESLYDEVVQRAAALRHPLTFTEQLGISLLQNKGDLQNSLWQLFIASRYYARRRDGQSLSGVPTLDDRTKLESMVTWQQSLAACVPYEINGYQDAAGDTYYAWTHALAKFAFAALPQQPGPHTHAAERIFEHGTTIMQAFVNRFYKEGSGATARNHAKAAAYGNAIGQACVDVLSHQ